MHKMFSFNVDAGREVSTAWPPPDMQDPNSYAKRHDIWFLGHVLVEMLWGRNVTKTFTSPAQFLESVEATIPKLTRDIIARMFEV